MSLRIFFYTACIVTLFACEQKSKQQQQAINFESNQIADSVEFLWAYAPVDITGDDIADLVFSSNNAYGGSLGYYRGEDGNYPWKKHIIAARAPDNGTFASGDLECADADFDGDIDIFAVEHGGEWEAAGEPSILFWFENPGWQAHRIGEIPNFVKDIHIADFNKDQKMDIVALTFEDNTFSLYQQLSKDEWERVQFFENFKNVHEGMGAGDVNGDGFTDVVVNGIALYNPQGDLSAEWESDNIDPQWNTQEGDWSRNATKIFVIDINDDEKAEVFISHSERAGFPLSYYSHQHNGNWKKYIIADSIAACHTLQVADFDNDGYFDVLAGMNSSRAAALDKSSYPAYIFLGNKNYVSWTTYPLTEKGIYNGQVVDFENDGDVDVFRYPSHDSTNFYLYKNLLIE